MRIGNSIRNASFAWINQIIHIIAQFIARTAIIKTLSIEYVGLNGLFSNILMVLSLAELGVGTAITFSLYEPIAKDDKKKILAIMQFYRKVYCMIGIIIFLIGLSVTPFLSYFIKDIPDIENIGLIYILFVINTGISYFFSYKASYLNATQNNYVVYINHSFFEILMVLLQVLTLCLTKRFECYLIIGVLFVALQNISITCMTNKKYSFLLSRENIKLDQEIFLTIKKNTMALVFHKIGSIIVFATDNLIISKFVGIVSTGIFSNYTMVTDAMCKIISKAFDAISASVGNLVIQESKEKQKSIFFNIMFLNFVFYAILCACLIAVLNRFMLIWVGKKFLLSIGVVFVLVLKLYITGMRGSVQTFKNAMGLYWNNKFMPIAEAVINLIVSVIFVRHFGIVGVMAGTIISSICTCVWIEPLVLFRDGLHSNLSEYVKRYILYFILSMILCLSSYAINQFELNNIYFDLIAHLIITFLFVNLIIFTMFREFGEYKFFRQIINNTLKATFRKK